MSSGAKSSPVSPFPHPLDHNASPPFLTDKPASRLAHHDQEPLEKEIIEEQPYSVFTSHEKWMIVIMVSFAGMFRSVSPMLASPISFISVAAHPLRLARFHLCVEHARIPQCGYPEKRYTLIR
jgi:hypothetical protein